MDVILAPATPRPAQKIGQETFTVRGTNDAGAAERGAAHAAHLLHRPAGHRGAGRNRGEPDGGDALPVGMQIIAAPWREDVCFRVARALERLGVARFVGQRQGKGGVVMLKLTVHAPRSARCPT